MIQPPGGSHTTDAAVVLRGGLWATVSRVLPQLYVFLVSIPAARFLGPEALGRQSFISFIQLSLILLLTGGLSVALVRHVGSSLGGGRLGVVRRLQQLGWVLEGLAACIGGSVLVAAALLGAEPQAAWVLAGVACAIGVLHSVPSAMLVGAQLWRSASIVGIVTGAISAVAVVLVLAAGGGITGMFAVEVAVSAVNLLWTTRLMRRAFSSLEGSDEPSPADWRALRGDLLRFAALASYGVLLTLIVWRRSEFLFLERYSTETELAMYSIVFAFVAALGQLPDAAGAVTLPAVANLASGGHSQRIADGFATALRLLLLVSLPLTAGMLALGPQLLRLIYGGEYAGTRPVLLVMMAAFPLVPLLYVCRALLAGLGRLRVALAAETVAAIVNVALALWLIPDHGAVGAAGANVGAQATAAVLILGYALWVVGPIRWRPLALSRGAAAAGGAGVAAWAVASLGGAAGLLSGAAVGLTAFLALAVLLRIVPSEDAVWLEQRVGNSFGGFTASVIRRMT